MLFKSTKETTKEEREEIEMRLIQIDEVSAEMNQKIGSKLSKIDCRTNSKLEELTKEMEEIRE